MPRVLTKKVHSKNTALLCGVFAVSSLFNTAIHCNLPVHYVLLGLATASSALLPALSCQQGKEAGGAEREPKFMRPFPCRTAAPLRQCTGGPAKWIPNQGLSFFAFPVISSISMHHTAVTPKVVSMALAKPSI